MATQNETKLKILFKVLKPGCVVTSALLESFGISRNLQKYYLRSGWLEPLGRSAYKKPGDTIKWHGAINAIQSQSEVRVHVGGLSALALQGFGHYFRLSNEALHLFSPLKTKLPKWFLTYNWELEIMHHQSSFLPVDIGTTGLEMNQLKINISSPERALLECLFLAPKKMDLVECYHLCEGLVNLKPKLLNELLVNCTSIKVKRLFLYMADKASHQWFPYLKTEKINLGAGNRMLSKNGIYIPDYSISVPKELAEL